jgi:hypothetical protein
VRRELVHANLRRELLDDVPDEFFRHPFAPDLAQRYSRGGRGYHW